MSPPGGRTGQAASAGSGRGGGGGAVEWKGRLWVVVTSNSLPHTKLSRHNYDTHTMSFLNEVTLVFDVDRIIR